MTDSTSPIGDDLGLGLTVPGGTAPDPSGRRHVHPITPIVHGATALPVGFIMVLGFSGGVIGQLGSGGLLIALLLLLVLPFVVAGFSYLSWRNLWFWFDDDGDFRVDSGVLNTQQRRLQLSRLQSVDVAQPLFARVFSMAEVNVEVAGSRESRVKLRYLSLADARALRSELLARAAGLRHDTAEAPEAPIAVVPPRDLAVSLLLRTTTAGLLLITVAVLVVTMMTSGFSGLVLALFTGGIPILLVFNDFMRYFNFTVLQSPDGLRLRFGLARTETRTVPPGRVQAIEFVEPLLWRRWNWVRLRVNIAGVGTVDSQGNKEETVLTPVSPRPVADEIVARVLPGVDLPSLDWHAAPRRSRWRSPIQWGRLAVAWDDRVFATRRGRLTRRITVIPHARTQSVRWTQGPWERALTLASVHVDSTPGPVQISGLHIDAETAQSVAYDQSRRAEQGRAQDDSTHWAK